MILDFKRRKRKPAPMQCGWCSAPLDDDKEAWLLHFKKAHKYVGYVVVASSGLEAI